jgi:hypothetical protein
MARETDEELAARIARLRDELHQKKRELRTAEAKRERRMCGPPRRYPHPFSPEGRELHDMACQIIDTGFKELAKEMHPDAGGSHDDMARLNQVRAQFKARIA